MRSQVHAKATLIVSRCPWLQVATVASALVASAVIALGVSALAALAVTGGPGGMKAGASTTMRRLRLLLVRLALLALRVRVVSGVRSSDPSFG